MTEKQAIEILAKNINAELNRRNWDPIDLARRSGIDRKTIYHIVNADGAFSPKLSTLIRIANALDMTPVELFSWPSHNETMTAVEAIRDAYIELYRRERERQRGARRG